MFRTIVLLLMGISASSCIRLLAQEPVANAEKPDPSGEDARRKSWSPLDPKFNPAALSLADFEVPVPPDSIQSPEPAPPEPPPFPNDFSIELDASDAQKFETLAIDQNKGLFLATISTGKGANRKRTHYLCDAYNQTGQRLPALSEEFIANSYHRESGRLIGIYQENRNADIQLMMFEGVADGAPVCIARWKFHFPVSPWLDNHCVWMLDQRHVAVRGLEHYGVWNIETGLPLWYRMTADPLTTADVSHCGRFMATNTRPERPVQVIALQSGQLVTMFHSATHGIKSLRFSPDNKELLVAGQDGEAYIHPLEPKGKGRRLHILVADKRNPEWLDSTRFSSGPTSIVDSVAGKTFYYRKTKSEPNDSAHQMLFGRGVLLETTTDPSRCTIRTFDTTPGNELGMLNWEADVVDGETGMRIAVRVISADERCCPEMIRLSFENFLRRYGIIIDDQAEIVATLKLSRLEARNVKFRNGIPVEDTYVSPVGRELEVEEIEVEPLKVRIEIGRGDDVRIVINHEFPPIFLPETDGIFTDNERKWMVSAPSRDSFGKFTLPEKFFFNLNKKVSPGQSR